MPVGLSHWQGKTYLIAASTTDRRFVVGDDFFLLWRFDRELSEGTIRDILKYSRKGIVNHVEKVARKSPEQVPRPECNPTSNECLVLSRGDFRLQLFHLRVSKHRTILFIVVCRFLLNSSEPLNNAPYCSCDGISA